MSTSVVSNRISTVISAEVFQAAVASLEAIMQTLGPLLITLGNEDRRGMPHMGDVNTAWVIKVLGYARSHPQFMPPYSDTDELQKDVDLVVLLRPFLAEVLRLAALLQDTIDLAGSEAIMGALPYYTTVKGGAKLGQPHAAPIAADLGTRFEGQRRQGKKEPPEKA